MTESDQLFEQARQGDQRALNALFAGQRDYLRRVIELRMDDELRGRIDASDVIQETQLTASRRLADFVPEGRISFRLWLRQTAIERLIDLQRHHVRAQKRSVRREVRVTDQSSRFLAQRMMTQSPSRIVDRRELAERVRETVEDMSETDREILLLRHFEELTNAEISQLLGLDPGTVRKRYGRAIRRFRDRLADRGITGG